MRLVDSPAYYIPTTKYSSAKKETTREPVDGWYIFECISEGEKVTVKTKDKKAANFLDSQGPQCFALIVNENGEIQEYYETTSVTGGSKVHLNTIVKKMNEGKGI